MAPPHYTEKRWMIPHPTLHRIIRKAWPFFIWHLCHEGNANKYQWIPFHVYVSPVLKKEKKQQRLSRFTSTAAYVADGVCHCCLEDKRVFRPFLARAHLIYRQHYVHLLQQYCILKHQADICFLENVSVVVGKGLFSFLLRNWFFYSFLWQFRERKTFFRSLMGFTLLVPLVIPLLFFFLKVFIFHFSTRFIALH